MVLYGLLGHMKVATIWLTKLKKNNENGKKELFCFRKHNLFLFTQLFVSYECKMWTGGTYKNGKLWAISSDMMTEIWCLALDNWIYMHRNMGGEVIQHGGNPANQGGFCFLPANTTIQKNLFQMTAAPCSERVCMSWLLNPQARCMFTRVSRLNLMMPLQKTPRRGREREGSRERGLERNTDRPEIVINDSGEEEGVWRRRRWKGGKVEVIKRDLKMRIWHLPQDHSEAEERRKPTRMN